MFKLEQFDLYNYIFEVKERVALFTCHEYDVIL